jgi:hypothetical protein
MRFQFDVAASLPSIHEPSGGASSSATDLLAEILAVQREQLTQLRSSANAQDSGARWKAFLSRWQEDFPDLPNSCRDALPILERAYGALIADLADNLRNNGSLDNEFALGEFLDRYGMRVGQLGTLLSVVAWLAEAATQGESST